MTSSQSFRVSQSTAWLVTFLQGLDMVGGQGSLGVWVTTCSLPLGPQCQQNISNACSHLGQDSYEAVSNKSLKKKELQKCSSSFMLPKGKRCGLPAPSPRKCVCGRNCSISPVWTQNPRRKRSKTSTLDSQPDFTPACTNTYCIGGQGCSQVWGLDHLCG